jgi:phosphate transport system substrate-binding protein
MKSLVAGALFVLFLFSGCTSTQKTAIVIDGSSTVFPIAERWAESYSDQAGAQITVKFSGTGAGFQKFCRGETDVSDASRRIKDSEKSDCASHSIEPYEIQVAIDGLAVVVHPSNTFVDNLKVSELNKIWTANQSKQANKWSDIRSDWPAEKIKLFGPGTNSGTFDYFVEVIVHPYDGTETKGRSDYVPSEDDNILVQGVAGDANALGYFGLAYARENPDKVKVVPIVDDGPKGKDSGPVMPTDADVESGKYSPLSRPLFMYTKGQPTGALQKWIQMGLSDEGQADVSEVGYVKMGPTTLEAQRAKVA